MANGWEWSHGHDNNGDNVWQGLEGDATAIIMLTPRGWEAEVFDLLCDGRYIVPGIDPYFIMGMIEAAEHPSMWIFSHGRPAGTRNVSIG